MSSLRLAKAGLNTLNATRFTLFKAGYFGTITYISDDDGYVHKCALHKGKLYYLEAMPDVIGTPFDMIVGIVRTGLAIVGALALALHLGLYYGGFYAFLAAKYPASMVAQFLGG